MTASTPASSAPAPGRALRRASQRPAERPPDPGGAGLSPVPREPHPSVLCRRLPGLLLLLALPLVILGCNAHPLVEFEQAVQGAVRETFDLPAKSAIDLLFVIDDSQSMCEEQEALAANFERLADFFFERLGAEADLRIAVTSTDVGELDGRFVSEIPDGLHVACPEAQVAPVDCSDVIDDPVLSTGAEGNVGRDCVDLEGAAATACVRADLERRFRCLASRGALGNTKEKGLESMRRALSCDGPNGARFGACCTPAGYDPSCPAEGPRPEFLRPEALLVVVIVSDEDDCSTPADNRPSSDRLVCRDSALSDRDGDGVPDAFADLDACRGLGPADCMRAECGDLSPADCAQTRCEVVGTDYSSCAWEHEALTPVADYVRFLSRLKAEPAEQLLVAAIVGERIYTSDGFPVSFRPPGPDPICSAATLESSGPSDTCCPGGVCRGAVQAACRTEIGRADSGERYLQLAETIGALGLDCVDEATSLCEGDLVQPLEALSGCIQQSFTRFCLDKPVAQLGRARVTLSCLDETRCAALLPPMALPDDDFALVADPRCASEWMLRLDAPLPAGARLAIDYLVAH